MVHMHKYKHFNILNTSKYKIEFEIYFARQAVIKDHVFLSTNVEKLIKNGY